MTTAEQRNDQAFMNGVLETAQLPVIWVDPKQFKTDDIALKAEMLKQQLEAQIPNAADAMATRAKEIQANLGNIWARNRSNEEVLQVYAEAFDKEGPRVVSSVEIAGQQYCVINKPNEFVDSKDEILDIITHGIISKEQYTNFAGTDEDWNKLFGVHEGAHCPTPDILSDDTDLLNEEARADRITISKFDRQIAESWADTRHIYSFKNDISGIKMDAVHSSGILLGQEEYATDWHLAAAKTYKHVMDQAVQDTFDWNTYKGSAKTPDALLKENPQEYFKALQDGLEPIKQQVIETYQIDPSYDNTATALITQNIINYAENFEGAYRRRELSQDIPFDRPQTQIVSAQAEHYFQIDFDQQQTKEMIAFNTGEDFRYKRPNEYIPFPMSPALTELPDHHKQQIQAAKTRAYGHTHTHGEYAQGLDGTAFTTKVNTPAGGEPTINYENGSATLAGDTEMTDFFAQNANPAAQDITLINPTIADTSQGPEAIETQSGLNTQMK
ncbi:MAG: hypothetical protein ACRBCK_08315 [Alphaproteobacteria bacterium]